MKTISEILANIRPEFDFAASENFFDDGYLDSFDLITLVAELDKTFGIKIKGTDIVPENFCNIKALQEFLKGYGVVGAV